MSLERAGYKQVTQAAASTIKSGPGALFCIVVTASTAGTVTIYDNTSAAGTVLFAKDGLAKGEVIHFGGVGLACNVGMHVVVGGTGTVNILYT